MLMNIIKKISGFINDNEYRLQYINNSINIINYKEIKEFGENKIIVSSSYGLSIINGSNLVVSKMLDNEILITGTITNIEFK